MGIVLLSLIDDFQYRFVKWDKNTDLLISRN